MQGIIIGLNNPSLFFYLTNSVKKHENTTIPLAESVRLSVFQHISANNLITLNVYVSRKKRQPKVSPVLGENGVKLFLMWIFDIYIEYL